MNTFRTLLSVTVASQSHRWNNLSVRNRTSHQNKQALSPVIHYLSLQSVLLLTFPLMCLYGLFMLCQSLASFASFIYLEALVFLSCRLRGGEVGSKLRWGWGDTDQKSGLEMDTWVTGWRGVSVCSWDGVLWSGWFGLWWTQCRRAGADAFVFVLCNCMGRCGLVVVLCGSRQ